MSISEVTVKGTYKKADGSPETGTVKFRPALWQQSGSGIDAVLDSSGSFQTKFPSSDSGNWPDGLQIPYRVTVAVSSGTYVKELTFKTADSPIDLPTLFPIVSADSGGSGGSGGVPAAHAATHQPGGSDELPALLTLGNRLTWAEWTCAPGSFSVAGATCTASYDNDAVLLIAAAEGIGGGWAGASASGRVPVTPGTTVTASAMASIDSAAAARDARMRLYFWPGAALTQGTTVVVPLGGGMVELRHTAVVPAGATAVSCYVNFWPIGIGERVRLTKPALWIGAGGEARPPGEIIPGLGGGGGVPAAHAATHQPGGSDELPELSRLGNRLPWAMPRVSQCQVTELPTGGADGGPAARLHSATSTASAAWGGWTDRGNILLDGPAEMTGHARVDNVGPVGLSARVRVYFFSASGASVGIFNGPIVALPVGSGRQMVTAVVAPPAGATSISLWLVVYSASQNITPPNFELVIDRIGWWLGAGGEWRPPGEPIPRLGFRTTKLNNAELLSVWQGGKWVPLSGDTGIFTVGNGTIRRVGNSVYLTATGYTPPVGFRPAQGGTAPTNVWYITVDDWPTSAPGSAKL